MRVGGSRIVSVDVRIVAATNEDLARRVAEGSFRRDLFYRLNTLPVEVPPLSCRGDDVFLLLEHFRRELGGTFTLSEPVRAFFRTYAWPGNIRELRNVAEYFLYTGHDLITLEDLPSTVLGGGMPCPPPAELSENAGAAFVMEELYQASERGESLGRERLLSAAREAHLPLTQPEVRRILADLAARGLVRVSRGRGGSRLTPLGRQVYENGQNV